MKKFALVLILTIGFLPFVYGQKTRPGPPLPKAGSGTDYPLNLHISNIRIGRHCSDFKGNSYVHGCIFATGLVDGKQLELIGERVWLPTFAAYPVAPGDYKARLLKNKSKAGALPLDSEYELVLSDQSIWRCTVTGIS